MMYWNMIKHNLVNEGYEVKGYSIMPLMPLKYVNMDNTDLVLERLDAARNGWPGVLQKLKNEAHPPKTYRW